MTRARAHRRTGPVALLALACLPPPAVASADAPPAPDPIIPSTITATTLTTTSLALDLSRALAQPEAAAPPEEGAAEPGAMPDPIINTRRGKPRKPYGRAGSEWLTFGAGFAYDLAEDKDINLHAAYSQFLADELEFGVELGGWYFAQDRDDTGGISGSILLRWHHCHAEDFSWTLYSDVGIGILAAFDETPQGGQEFNFLPRIGGGYTHRIADDGTRLQIGARWHHISNGRYTGDTRNPSRDSIMVYAAIVIPF